MKKLIFLLGAAVGFVLGSKAGTGPYQQIEEGIRSAITRLEMQEAAVKMKDSAHDRADDAAAFAEERMSAVG